MVKFDPSLIKMCISATQDSSAMKNYNYTTSVRLMFLSQSQGLGEKKTSCIIIIIIVILERTQILFIYLLICIQSLSFVAKLESHWKTSSQEWERYSLDRWAPFSGMVLFQC